MANVTTELSTEELIEAAVAVVRDRVAEAMAAEGRVLMSDEYVASHTVTSDLTKAGVLVETPNRQDYAGKELARQAAERKTKRALDAEAAKPDARILRFSSRDNAMLPRLDGSRRRLYSQMVAYTTPELYAKAQAAVDARLAGEKTDVAEFEALLERARAAGLRNYEVGLDRRVGPPSLHFDLDATRKLVALLERA